MADLRFAWDLRKAQANRRKHRVSFEEAETVFLDEHGLLLDDPDEPRNEERFVLIGMSAGARILVVCHCQREADSLIRIISARRAGKHEQADYWSRLRR